MQGNFKRFTYWGRNKMAAMFPVTSLTGYLNENIWISIKIALTFVPRSLVDSISALVHIMAWHRPGYKPIIWTNDEYLTDAYMRHSASMLQGFSASVWDWFSTLLWCERNVFQISLSWFLYGSVKIVWVYEVSMQTIRFVSGSMAVSINIKICFCK